MGEKCCQTSLFANRVTCSIQWRYSRNCVAETYGKNQSSFSCAKVNGSDYNFSFNGLKSAVLKQNVKNKILLPVIYIFCTDNVAMIGVVGYYEYIKGIRNDYNLNAILNLKLGEKNK